MPRSSHYHESAAYFASEGVSVEGAEASVALAPACSKKCFNAIARLEFGPHAMKAGAISALVIAAAISAQKASRNRKSRMVDSLSLPSFAFLVGALQPPPRMIDQCAAVAKRRACRSNDDTL